MSSTYKFDDTDFIIYVKPSLDDDGEWDGDLQFAVSPPESNLLTNEDFYTLTNICKSMVAALPILESEPRLIDKLRDYMENNIDTQYEIELEPEPKILKEEGNVTTINFSTRTKGEA